MPDSELMPIGDFARRSGLTSSALRFYADSGLLHPAEVDPASGYRYYTADQVNRPPPCAGCGRSPCRSPLSRRSSMPGPRRRRG